MNGLKDYLSQDTIKYPFQICGIFKTPARTTSDNIIIKTDSGSVARED
jgi:hypothetical protein